MVPTFQGLQEPVNGSDTPQEDMITLPFLKQESEVRKDSLMQENETLGDMQAYLSLIEKNGSRDS